MIRVQAQLTKEQAERLRRLSAERGVSVAALLREGAERVLADGDRDAAWERAMKAIRNARGTGAHDVSEEHDRYLDDAFSA